MRLLQTAVISLILGLWGCGSRTMLEDYIPDGTGLPPSTGSSPDPDLPKTVYAVGGKTLYVLTPDLTSIQSTLYLKGCDDEALDVAVDAHGTVFVTTRRALYQVQLPSGDCELRHESAYPESLAFLPPAASGRELLVGYDDSIYYNIDLMTGWIDVLGELDANYSAHGDIAVVPSGRAYITVTGIDCGDCLAEIDPMRGALIHMVGPLGQSEVYGLAAVGDALYGFNYWGDMMRIDPETGAAQIVPLGNAQPDMSFVGAASPPPVLKP